MCSHLLQRNSENNCGFVTSSSQDSAPSLQNMPSFQGPFETDTFTAEKGGFAKQSFPKYLYLYSKQTRSCANSIYTGQLPQSV